MPVWRTGKDPWCEDTIREDFGHLETLQQELRTEEGNVAMETGDPRGLVPSQFIFIF